MRRGLPPPDETDPCTNPPHRVCIRDRGRRRTAAIFALVSAIAAALAALALVDGRADARGGAATRPLATVIVTAGWSGGDHDARCVGGSVELAGVEQDLIRGHAEGRGCEKEHDLAAATSILIFRTRVLPRWLAWLGIIVAASLVVDVTYVNILPFVGWVGAVSIVLLRRREETANAVARGSEYNAAPVTVPR